MMELKDLVPPLELCKLIPAGEFADSVALWVFFPKSDKKFHLYIREDIDWSKSENYPAPTLQEILEDLPQGVELNRDSEWFCSLDMTNEYYDKTPVTAALKVWLKLKGIEV